MFSSPLQDFRKAQKFVTSEKRTGKNKYYASKVIATLNEMLALFERDREASLLMMRQMMSDVLRAHLVRSHALFSV